MVTRDANGKFIKGQSGNPAGRPGVSTVIAPEARPDTLVLWTWRRMLQMTEVEWQR